jgi:hypothetical protein
MRLQPGVALYGYTQIAFSLYAMAQSAMAQRRISYTAKQRIAERQWGLYIRYTASAAAWWGKRLRERG